MFELIEKFYQYAWRNNKPSFWYLSTDPETISSHIEKDEFALAFGDFNTEISTCHFVFISEGGETYSLRWLRSWKHQDIYDTDPV